MQISKRAASDYGHSLCRDVKCDNPDHRLDVDLAGNIVKTVPYPGVPDWKAKDYIRPKRDLSEAERAAVIAWCAARKIRVADK